MESTPKTTAENRMPAVKESMLTERGLGAYRKILRITDADLEKWRTIVDLGAGLEQNLAREIKSAGLDNKIISVDPSLALSEEEDLARLFPEEHEARRAARNSPAENTISSFAQDLPIEDASVDAVLALHSITQYIEDPEELYKAFEEIYRILRDGGEARLYPILKTKNLNLIMNLLKRLHFKSEFIFVERVLDEEKFVLFLLKQGAEL